MSDVTLIGAGTALAGNNTSLTPALHASSATGDVLLLFATIRSTTATPAVPAGWSALVQDGNVLLAGKIKAAVEPAPTVTFTGGVSGDTTLAQVATFRNATLNVSAGPVIQHNASATQVALPGSVTPAAGGALLLYVFWKQTSWTGAGAFADGEIGDISSALGSTAAMAWDYEVQTGGAAASLTGGNITITGGTSSVSRIAVLSLAKVLAITAVEQNVYPPRVQVTVSNLVIGDAVEVYRQVGVNRTLVQGGYSPAVSDTAFLVVDAQLPFGVPVSYVAIVGGVEYATTPTTHTLPGGKVVLSDAISGLAAEAVIWAWPEKAWSRAATVFRPGNRNVVVGGQFSQFEADIELYTDAESSADNLLALLENATQGIIQIRQSGGYGGVDRHVAVTSYQQRRWSQDGSDEKRIHALHIVEVDGWAPGLSASGFTYADLAAAYAGLTYNNLAADFPTYLDLAQGDFS